MNKDAGRTAIFGASGSGKSTKAKELLQQQPRALIFDPLGEYDQAGAKLYRSLPALASALRKQWGGPFMLAYVPPKVGKVALALHHFANFVLRVQQPYFDNRRGSQKLAVVVEEMALSFPVTALPETMRGFVDVCLRGRHYGVELIGISQRPANVSADFRGNVTRTFWYMPEFEEDVRVAVKQMRFAEPRIEQRLRGLQKHEYLLYEGRKVTEGRNPPPGRRKVS